MTNFAGRIEAGRSDSISISSLPPPVPSASFGVWSIPKYHSTQGEEDILLQQANCSHCSHCSHGERRLCSRTPGHPNIKEWNGATGHKDRLDPATMTIPPNFLPHDSAHYLDCLLTIQNQKALLKDA